jgi:hypothetical protein
MTEPNPCLTRQFPRRELLQGAKLAIGGLPLFRLLQSEAEAGTGSSPKSVVMVFLEGGPSHIDTWDMKPDAPAEIRGEFRPIPTNVSGINVSEHLPQLATQMNRFAVLRSIVDSIGVHTSYQCETGRRNRPTEPAGGWPSMGAVLQKFAGRGRVGVPTSVTLSPYTRTGGGFFGPAYQLFKPEHGALADMALNESLPLSRLDQRLQLASSFCSAGTSARALTNVTGANEFHRKAYDVLSSPALATALDIDSADQADRERFRTGVAPRYWQHVEKFLSARRLIEAGARYVMVSIGGFDTHKYNFRRQRSELLPILDSGLTNLVVDLHDRGLQNDVSVLAWGEFGRSPTLQGVDGRDHWPRVNSALLAGGGMQTGQVIGGTDRLGGEVISRPTCTGEVFATIYKCCGLDASRLTGTDLSGRPLHLVDRAHTALPELL